MYDIEYHERMLRLNSASAESINSVRWDFIADIKPKKVLDYGSGVGWFRAYRPEGVIVHSYDIMPTMQTGMEITLYDVVCFWDVLEHIPTFEEIEPALALSSHVALSIPIKPPEKPYFEWKHLKPREHLHFLDKEAVYALFNRYGFGLMKEGTPECPPREDVVSMLFWKEPYLWKK